MVFVSATKQLPVEAKPIGAAPGGDFAGTAGLSPASASSRSPVSGVEIATYSPPFGASGILWSAAAVCATSGSSSAPYL